MEIKYEIKGVTLDVYDMIEIKNYYQTATIAEVLFENYELPDEDAAMQLGEIVRERMDEDGITEDEAILDIIAEHNIERREAVPVLKESDCLKITNPYSHIEYEVKIIVSNYVKTGNLYVGLMNKAPEGYWERYIDLTVNLKEPLPENFSYIDTNNAGEDILNWLMENNLGVITGEYGYSGYCSYPKFEFNIDELKKYQFELTSQKKEKSAIEQYAKFHSKTSTSETDPEQRERERKPLNELFAEANSKVGKHTTNHMYKATDNLEL